MIGAHLTGLVDINCGVLKNLLYKRAMWNGIPEYIPGNQALFFCLTESIIMKPSIMGHKDISITLNLYSRVMKENKIAAMNGVNIKMSEG